MVETEQVHEVQKTQNLAQEGGAVGEAGELGLDGGANASKVVKSFRHIPEIENFYRYVHDNDLRREAKIYLSQLLPLLTRQKGKKKSSKLLN